MSMHVELLGSFILQRNNVSPELVVNIELTRNEADDYINAFYIFYLNINKYVKDGMEYIKNNNKEMQTKHKVREGV